jgi:hypothetical protein
MIEVMGSIALFSLVFLAGTGYLAQLLMIQGMNQQRTFAGTAAMLITDWHVDRAVAIAPSTRDLVATTTAAGDDLLVEQFSPRPAPWDNVTFSGGEITRSGPDADRMFTFAGATVADARTGANLDLARYRDLLVTISPPSAPEADAKLSFRQVAFWYLPPGALARATGGQATAANPVVAQFLGRYLLPDCYHP